MSRGQGKHEEQDGRLKKTKTSDTCNSELEEAPPAPLVITKSDSGITWHLKTTPECRKAVCANPAKRFKVLVKARNSGHLSWRLYTFLIFHLSCVCKKNLYEFSSVLVWCGVVCMCVTGVFSVALSILVTGPEELRYETCQ